MKKEVVRVKVNGESVVRGARWMIEKRRFGLCTVTIPPSKTRTSGMRSQSLRVPLVEDNPLAGALGERTVANDMSWVIAEGASLIWADAQEMAEASAKGTVVARATILGVARGMLSAVRTLILRTVNAKMPVVVTLKTNSRCKHSGLWAQAGITRCNLSGVGSGVPLMKGRAGFSRLVDESEGDGLWGRDGITLRRFSGGGRGRSGHG